MENLSMEEKCVIVVALKQFKEKLEGFIQHNEENIPNYWITDNWKKNIDTIDALLPKIK